MGQYQETFMTQLFSPPRLIKQACVAIGLASMACIAYAQTDVTVSVGGVIQPGVYGRVVIGSRPPPPVIYPQPVIITQAPVVIQQAPIYMHVPPGHAKKWSKHCYKYNACNQPVYFVQNHYHGYQEHGKHGRKEGKHHGKHGHHD
jgi:hypothetical protein